MQLFTLGLVALIWAAAFRLWKLDSRLDEFRVGAPEGSRGLSPFRWRYKFYPREADPLLGQIWMTVWAFYALGIFTLICAYFAFDMGEARTAAG